MLRSLLALGSIIVLLSGCAPKSTLATQNGPRFDPLAFFDGHTHSQGVIENRSGAPTAWIVTDTDGQRLANGRLRLVQTLTYQDGTTQQRDWTLWRAGPGRYDATANDMIGTASGRVTGPVFHWHWVLAREPLNVTMNQWMYQMPDGSVIIRTTVTKFGFIAAEVTEQFVKVAG